MFLLFCLIQASFARTVNRFGEFDIVLVPSPAPLPANVEIIPWAAPNPHAGFYFPELYGYDRHTKLIVNKDNRLLTKRAVTSELDDSVDAGSAFDALLADTDTDPLTLDDLQLPRNADDPTPPTSSSEPSGSDSDVAGRRSGGAVVSSDDHIDLTASSSEDADLPAPAHSPEVVSEVTSRKTAGDSKVAAAGSSDERRTSTGGSGVAKVGSSEDDADAGDVVMEDAGSVSKKSQLKSVGLDAEDSEDESPREESGLKKVDDEAVALVSEDLERGVELDGEDVTLRQWNRDITRNQNKVVMNGESGTSGPFYPHHSDLRRFIPVSLLTSWGSAYREQFRLSPTSEDTLICTDVFIPESDRIEGFPIHSDGSDVYYGAVGYCVVSNRYYNHEGFGLSHLDGRALLRDPDEYTSEIDPRVPIPLAATSLHDSELGSYDRLIGVYPGTSAIPSECYNSFSDGDLAYAELQVPGCTGYYCRTGRLVNAELMPLYAKGGVPLFLDRIPRFLLGHPDLRPDTKHFRAYTNYHPCVRPTLYALGPPETPHKLLKSCLPHHGTRQRLELCPEVYYYHAKTHLVYDHRGRQLFTAAAHQVRLADLGLLRNVQDPARDAEDRYCNDGGYTACFYWDEDLGRVRRLHQARVPELAADCGEVDFGMEVKMAGGQPICAPAHLDIDRLDFDEDRMLCTAVLRGIAYSKWNFRPKDLGPAGRHSASLMAGMSLRECCLLFMLVWPLHHWKLH